MGRVYEVERVVDGMRLALKVLARPDGMAELRALSREAQIAGTLRHPNVVALVDVDVAPTGFLYLVMELVSGTSLREHGERYGDVTWAMGILRQVSEGLTAIHACGVVHRDLKPANVLIVGEHEHAAIRASRSPTSGCPAWALPIPAAGRVAAPAAPRARSIWRRSCAPRRSAIELSDLDQTPSTRAPHPQQQLACASQRSAARPREHRDHGGRSGALLAHPQR